jgi:hypothetical protein
VFGAGCPRRASVVARFSEQRLCSPASQRHAVVAGAGYVQFPKSNSGHRSSARSSRTAVCRFSPRLLPAPAGHRSLCRNLLLPKGLNCSLRRCTCGGIIAASLFGVIGPSFKAEQEFRGWQGASAVHIPTSASFGVCRITNRCSGPGHIKCSAAGVDVSSSPHRFRARVLTSQLAAAELSRYAP